MLISSLDIILCSILNQSSQANHYDRIWDLVGSQKIIILSTLCLNSVHSAIGSFLVFGSRTGRSCVSIGAAFGSTHIVLLFVKWVRLPPVSVLCRVMDLA